MAQAPQQQQGIALDQFSRGLIDDVDVEIVDAAFAQWDYDGKIDHEILALGIQYQYDDGQGGAKTFDQYYSAGELTYFTPADDGSCAIPVADKTQLTESCNAAMFLRSLMECEEGIRAILGTGNVKNLVGLKCHVKRQAQPKRQGLIRGGEQKEREDTVLLVSQVYSLPSQGTTTAKKGLAGQGKPVTKPAPKPASTQAALRKGGLKSASAPATPKKVNGAAGTSTTTASDDDKTVAMEILTAILVEKDGTVEKGALPALAFKHAGAMVSEGKLDAKNKTKVVQLIYMDSFLHELTEQGAIQFDGATVSLAG